eukprot:4089320-Amphidinium_carterae.1
MVAAIGFQRQSRAVAFASALPIARRTGPVEQLNSRIAMGPSNEGVHSFAHGLASGRGAPCYQPH